MNSVSFSQPSNVYSIDGKVLKIRGDIQGCEARVLSNIYREDINIVVWQRTLDQTLMNDVDAFLKSNPNFQVSMIVTPQDVLSSLSQALGDKTQFELAENITELVDMFCCLFELKRVGLRLAALDRAMCPKFHADKIPCRLVTTFQGIATEWLPHQVVNRSKLGLGSKGKADYESGLYQNSHDIQQLNFGDVALLKGELWEGNENAGLVHRSPALPSSERRLLLTLDFIG
ncbi:MAG: DUF1826 domain-containing protein [Rhodobacterales bacterium]|jgi:hypothetical protein|tara:strand:+ start:130 stop:819 length:690 start_codon:yes stop_codon:yes gene_type:complete